MNILTVVNAVFGLSFVLGAVSFIWKRHGFRWNRIAAEYEVHDCSPPIAERRLQSIFLTGGGFAYASYKGTVTVGVTEDGVTLRLMPPWSVFHPPLHIPFEHILVKPTSWYLNSSCYKLTLAGKDDIEITTHGALVDWINSHAPKSLETSWAPANERVAAVC